MSVRTPDPSEIRERPRICVTGSRHWTNHQLVEAVLSAYLPSHDLHVGDARGADALALTYARRIGVNGRVYRAHWDSEGKSAGPRRNERMLDTAGPAILIAFRLRDSASGARGTDHCIASAKRRGIPVILIEGDNLTCGGGR